MYKHHGGSNSYIAIDDEGYYSIITESETISNKYTYISYAFDNNFIFRNKEGFYGLLNIYTGTILDAKYNIILKVDGKDILQAVLPDGTVEIYSKNIEKTVSLADGVLESIDDNYSVLHSDTDMVYINKDGQTVLNTEVYPDNSIYAYCEDGKWGFKGKDESIAIEAKYDFATDLNEYGFAGIVQDGEWGVVNSKGEIIKQPSLELDAYYLPKFVGEYLLEAGNTYHCLEIQ